MIERDCKIVNHSGIPTEQLKPLIAECLKGKVLPSFYLAIHRKGCDGMTIYGNKKPVILVIYDSPEQFKRVLIHELVHLRQHSEGYSSEEEAYAGEFAG